MNNVNINIIFIILDLSTFLDCLSQHYSLSPISFTIGCIGIIF